MSRYCLTTGMLCQFANEFGYCSNTACTNPAKLTETARWNCTHTSDDDYGGIAAVPKSFEEELAETTNIQKVVDFLEQHGIQIKTKYGYYRDTYDVLKDISEHWEQLKDKF